MHRENIRLTNGLLLLFLLVSFSFAQGVCPSCFATHIGIMEKDGEITATLFEVDQNIKLTQNLAYFDDKTKEYLGGKEGLTIQQMKETESVISRDVKIEPVSDANLFFYYYDRIGTKKEIPGCKQLKTDSKQLISYNDYTIDPPKIKTKIIPYTICKIPENLYAHSSITIYIEFKGDQFRKPSEREITIYDISAGGLNVLARSLQNNIDPTSSACLGGLILIGLLFASMYFSGKSPLTYLDLTVPRVPKPKPIGFSPVIASTGNIRIAISASRDLKYLDKIIKYHSMADFRGLEKNIEAAINQSKRNGIKQSEVRKYIARFLAVRKEDWRQFLENGDEKVMLRRLEKEGAIPSLLLMAMNQHISAGKIVTEMGIVGGNPFQWVKNIVKYVRMVPLIGTFSGVGISSFSFTARTMKDMAKTLVSFPLRKVLGNEYDNLAKKKELTGINKIVYGIASMTDPKKIELGKLFPLHEYTKRFYDDTRDACYDEITINVLWQEIYKQLKKKNQESMNNILPNMMDFKKIFIDHCFIEALEEVKIPNRLLNALRNTYLSPKQQAEIALNYANANRLGVSSSFVNDARELYNKLNEIDTHDSSFVRARDLVKFMHERYHVNQPTDISHNILDGKFFMTVGRDNLYHEENGVKKNFGFFTLGLREFVQQFSFLGTKKSSESFTIADSFKLAWAKMVSQVFGNRDWYLEQGNDITLYDPALKKTRAASFVEDVLGMSKEDLKNVRNTMKDYLFSLMSDEGKVEATKVAKKGKAAIDVVENFLYGYDIKATKKAEEETLNPFRRRAWYHMESETYPDEKYWKPNMNFLWTSIGQVDHRTTILHLVRGEKYWANMPRSEVAWSLIENYMDTRFANILNGNQWDFFGYEKRGQYFERFSRVDMQKFFNETWNFYDKVNKALGSFYIIKTGKKSYSNRELENFLSNEKNIILTYYDLTHGKTPFIYTHDCLYIPYIKGMPVSDFDRIINGVFVLQDENGKQKRTLNINELNTKYNRELLSNDIYQKILNNIPKLKKQPLLNDISFLEQLLIKANLPTVELTSGLNILKKFSTSSLSIGMEEYATLADDGIRAAAAMRKIISSHSMDNTEKFKLLRVLDSVDPHMQTQRQLTQSEINGIRDILIGQRQDSAEIKIAFLKQFSAATQDYQSIWTDPKIKFFKLITEKQHAEEVGHQTTWFERLFDKIGLYNALRGIAQSIEIASCPPSRREFAAMGNAVSISELYRERGSDMRMQIKTPGYLDNELRSAYIDADRIKLEKAYDNYADSTHRFFSAYVPGFTRDPRGTSTQWGRQWYLQAMYQRGAAMGPESSGADAERSYLSPLGWFFAQTFLRSTSINWMLASPFVRMMRSFQTAAYGYPTIWDRNITPTGDFDLLYPWQYVSYSGWQKTRALFNPQESIFNVGKFRPGYIAARTFQLIPGLNMLSYLFPQLEPGSGGKELGKYGWYKNLTKVPGLGSILGQSHSQLSQRAGMDIRDGLKQRPEDFSQWKGGSAFHHFTDSANPGISYVGYRGQGMIASRIARHLVSNIGDYSLRQFYKSDSYLDRQASFSMARRGISAEMKRLHFQEELTGYGITSNPMWAPLLIPTFGIAAGKWIRKSSVPSVIAGLAGMTALGPAGALLGAPGVLYYGTKGARSYINKTKKLREEEARIRACGIPALEHARFMNKLYTKLSSRTHVCMFCGPAAGKRMYKGGVCPYCGRYS